MWRKNTKLRNFDCLRHPPPSRFVIIHLNFLSIFSSAAAPVTTRYRLPWKIISACLTQLNASLTVGSTSQKSNVTFKLLSKTTTVTPSKVVFPDYQQRTQKMRDKFHTHHASYSPSIITWLPMIMKRRKKNLQKLTRCNIIMMRYEFFWLERNDWVSWFTKLGPDAGELAAAAARRRFLSIV